MLTLLRTIIFGTPASDKLGVLGRVLKENTGRRTKKVTLGANLFRAPDFWELTTGPRGRSMPKTLDLKFTLRKE